MLAISHSGGYHTYSMISAYYTLVLGNRPFLNLLFHQTFLAANISSSSSEDVFKTSSRRPGQDQYIRLAHTSSRRLQDVLQKCLQDVFKTSLRHLQDVFKTYYQVKLFLVAQFQDIFETYSKCF